VYGIGHGARYYFGKPASALTPRECAFLAAMLPGPRLAYNPYKNLRRVLKRSDMIVKLMRQKGVLDEGEYRSALAEQPNVAGMQRKVDLVIAQPPVFTSPSSARKEAAEPSPGEMTEQPVETDMDGSGAQSSPPGETEQAAPTHE